MTDPGLSVAGLSSNARSLRVFSENLDATRTSITEDGSPLTSALSLIARLSEILADKIERLDPATADPDDFTADEMTLLVLLAGFTSGPQGFEDAFTRIKEITMTNETPGDVVPTAALDLTEPRREALVMVKDDRVQYDGASASYLVDGDAVGGWKWRTLSELRRANLITTESGREPSKVVCTDAGFDALV